jgi:hypothetical protein
MTNLNDLGIHVFEQNGPIKWEEEMMGVNLLSIITWKHFHGPIHLYCNDEFLQTLKKWNLDSLYDHIDTELLNTKPKDIDYSQYFAFSKIFVIKHLKDKTPFTLIDNDLWILSHLNFNKESDVLMYHKEDFDENHYLNVYPDFNNLVPDEIIQMNLNKSVKPTNAAILHFKNTDFVDQWYELSVKTALHNKHLNLPYPNKSIRMCFIEQRLLPMLLDKLSISYSTLIDHVYLSHKTEKQDGSEWYPLIENSTEEQLEKFASIKHVWGIKKYFHHEYIRNLVMDGYSNTLKDFESKNLPCLDLINYINQNYSHTQVLADSNL